MGITIEWHDEGKTILRQTFYTPWTWDEFYDKNAREIPSLMASVEHEVHVVSDFLQGASLPPLRSAIGYAAQAMKHYPENWGLLVIVSDNMLIKILVATFQKVNRNRLGEKTVLVQDIAEANALLDQY